MVALSRPQFNSFLVNQILQLQNPLLNKKCKKKYSSDFGPKMSKYITTRGNTVASRHWVILQQMEVSMRHETPWVFPGGESWIVRMFNSNKNKLLYSDFLYMCLVVCLFLSFNISSHVSRTQATQKIRNKVVPSMDEHTQLLSLSTLSSTSSLD